MLHRIMVTVAEAKISRDSRDVLVAYGLGSCIAVCLYDPVAHIGAMVHCQLPDSGLNAAKARKNPFMFVDTGLPTVIDKMLSMGANKRFIRTTVAGGASMIMAAQNSDMGRKNYQSVRKTLWQKNMFIDAQDVGGNSARTMYMSIADGTVTVRGVGAEKKLSQSPFSAGGIRK